MNSDEMVELCKRHTLYTWAASGAIDPLPVERAEGVYFYTPDGTRYLDFNSQLMSVNIGHGHPKVIQAIKDQAEKLTFIYPATATEPRARLGKLLAELTPGDINTFFFVLSGAEANNNAVRMARLYTGRSKILARYRSYHGATGTGIQLTGDPRRWFSEPGEPGVVHVMDPWPYHYSFGESDHEITKNNLTYLEEVIQYEGADRIAAMIIEPVTGTNGVLIPPEGYLRGLRALLDKYGILLITDEVMAGCGRTGRMFAFEHAGIVPDIVTMAKGLTSSYLPLGAVGVSDAIAAHFRDNIYWGGLTYNSHPLSCAAAVAALEVLRDEGLIDNAATLQPIMRAEMDRLARSHPSVKIGRCIGLFGMIDVQKNARGELIAPYGGSHPAMAEVAKFIKAEGLFTFLRWSHVMCNPPLCITEEQLLEGFSILDRAFEITDRAFEG
ncbi:MAG: aminotransferase class III-fold pyridoxal phosphate-dependent enzyme [Deltaproteobacteria bacterium]|nr:MAG: aminotransferase class III-fold pyridoxal phosphate-dependent enzyme [Deltaproteobacteria bacterium]